MTANVQAEILKIAKNSGGIGAIILLGGWMLNGKLEEIKIAVDDVSDQVEAIDKRVETIETEKRLKKLMEDEK